MTTQTISARREIQPLETVRMQLDKLRPQLLQLLPPHVPVERFQRTAMMAISNEPKLLEADRRSLFTAALSCARTGLLPDAKEAVLLPFKDKSGKQHVQFIPMVAGLLKLVRNSGEILSIAAHVVHEADEFHYELGDAERIVHRPPLGARGKPIAVYAIAKTKDGGTYREVMDREDVLAVRASSRSADKGPWSGPFELEMWRKTALRRLCKRLPMSTDLDAVLGPRDEPSPRSQPAPETSATGTPASAHAQAAERIDSETGEILSDAPYEREPGEDDDRGDD